MSSSPNIGFVPHNVARLLRKRLEKQSRASPDDRFAWLPCLTAQAGPLHEVTRGNGRRTRDEGFAGPSPETPQRRLQPPSLIKSNLLAARTQPAVDREKVHG